MRPVRGFADRRVVREREVVVGAEVDQFAAVGEPDHGLLRRGQHALRLEEAGALQVFGLGGQSVEKATIHGVGRLQLRSADYKGLIIGPWHPARTIRRAGMATTMNRTARWPRWSRWLSGSLRVDKWLWCTRFFKTRSLAQEAVDGGHVQIGRRSYQGIARGEAGRPVADHAGSRAVRRRRRVDPRPARAGRRSAPALPRNDGKRGWPGARPRVEPARPGPFPAVVPTSAKGAT